MELAFKEQLESEERARVAEKERQERERLEARKQREVQRITDVSFKKSKRYFRGFQYYSFYRREKRKVIDGRSIILMKQLTEGKMNLILT